VNPLDALSPPPYYVPRDEAFERGKNSDFLADTIRSKGHQLIPKYSAKIKPDFDSVDEIKRLYAPRGSDLGGLNNMLADDVNVPKEQQQPFVFLQELVRPDGQWNTPFQYPLPGILQGPPSMHSHRNPCDFVVQTPYSWSLGFRVVRV
jgi:hypothetical protein